MLTFIHLYPIFAICVALIIIDLARNLRRKGKPWVALLIFGFLILGSVGFWWHYKGYRNAEKWVKEWASLTFYDSTKII